jgi:single-strand DNA-binding protein
VETSIYVDGEKKERADFFNLILWGKRAESMSQWFKKGAVVGVQAELVNNNYTDSNGQKKYQDKILINKVSILKFPVDGEGNSGNAPSNEQDPVYV